MIFYIFYSLYTTQVISEEVCQLIFTIPIVDPLPAQYIVRVTHDKWMNTTTVSTLSFRDMILPQIYPPHTG